MTILEAIKIILSKETGGLTCKEIGLDKIYIQAKRYVPTNHVGRKDIQAFSGAMKKVTKGVFITTSSFTKEAKREVQEQMGKQIALILVQRSQEKRNQLCILFFVSISWIPKQT